MRMWKRMRDRYHRIDDYWSFPASAFDGANNKKKNNSHIQKRSVQERTTTTNTYMYVISFSFAVITTATRSNSIISTHLAPVLIIFSLRNRFGCGQRCCLYNATTMPPQMPSEHKFTPRIIERTNRTRRQITSPKTAKQKYWRNFLSRAKCTLERTRNTCVGNPNGAERILS